MSVGKQIQNLRFERGLTRGDLSILSGLSQNVLYSIEHEKHHPNRITLVKLALAFNLKPETFIEWHEPEEKRAFPLLLLVAQARKKMTTRVLSEKTGIPELTLSFYHRGRNQPTHLNTVIKLANALDVDLKEIIAAWNWNRLSQDCRKTDDGRLYCGCCKFPKEVTEFHNLTVSKSGKSLICKECREKKRKGETAA